MPTLAATAAAAKRLGGVLRKKSDEPLADLLAVAERTYLSDLVAELQKDITAVETALSLPWTTSPAEGQICRIKVIKRTIYDRAGFALLRARVIHAA
ncbi:hypothetical protein [Belnapia mucosa]|uniref:hypothetical protein n=1 Tax=Belnapia mucosa TaxID=2804532 RepID=UPI001F3091D9|nr:hypothetical protein [Belnapia mucosa]